MDVIEKIRQLAALMDANDLAELELQEPDLHVKIKTNRCVEYSARAFAGGQSLPAPSPPEAIVEQPAPEPASKGADRMLEIVSPMVGTFYRAPSEGAEPYVTVGSIVEPDTVVCIVEAMKVMNEVKAELSGEIAEILVQNAEPVEYGQVLFLVKPIEQ